MEKKDMNKSKDSGQWSMASGQKRHENSSLITHHSPLKAGFTLMELMVVIAIIVLLAGIMTPNVARRLERAKMTRAVADIAAIENAIAMYENDTGRYPESVDPIGGGRPPIEVLAWRLTARQADGTIGPDEQKISEDPKWFGPYIKGIDKDSWGEEYIYIKNTNPPNPTTYPDGGGAQEGYPDSKYGGSVDAPENLHYYIYSKGKNKLTSATNDQNKDDINNWDVTASWKEEY